MADTLAAADTRPDQDTAPQPLPDQDTQQQTGKPKQQTPRPATTPGGIPGIPVLTIGTGSAVTAVSSAGLVGGPGTAALVAGGLAATAALAAVTRAPRQRRTRKAASARTDSGRGSAQTGASRHGGSTAGAAGRIPSPSRSAGRPSAGKPAGGSSGGSRSAAGGLLSVAGHRPAGRPQAAGSRRGATGSATGSATGAKTQRQGGTAGAASTVRAARGRISQIRSARAQAAASPASRREQRQQRTADRRSVADARRQAKRDAKLARKHSPAAAAADLVKRGGAALKAVQADRKRDAKRQAADERRDQRVARTRRALAARLRARTRRTDLRRSAARYQARRLGAALTASPLGLLSLLLHWPARLFGLVPPQWGRRLYRHLAAKAQAERAARDQDIADAHQQAENDANTGTEDTADDQPVLGKKVARVTDNRIATDTEGVPVGIFDFRSHAEDMLNQATTGEAGGMMSVLSAFDGLPDTMGFLAQTFAVVAQRCADEMPLDPAVAEAIEDIYKQLLALSDAAEDVSKVFRDRHQVEIARFEDPRPGEQAWDIGAQE